MASTDDIQLDMLSQESSPNGVTISWRNLRVTPKPPITARGFEPRDILRGLSGIVRPGEMVALMGARYAVNFPKNIVSLKITYFLL